MKTTKKPQKLSSIGDLITRLEELPKNMSVASIEIKFVDKGMYPHKIEFGKC